MNFETIRVDVENGIQTITLHRPDKLNAFTGTMMNELIAAFDAADKNDDVRAVIVTGAGRAFCAGADLSAGADTFDQDKRGGRRAPAQMPDGGDDYADEAIRDGGGRVTLRIFESSEAGHRRDQRPGGRHRRDHALADGHPHRLRSGAYRLRFRPPGHCAWRLARAGSCRGSSASAGAANGRFRPGLRHPKLSTAASCAQVVPASRSATAAQAIAREIADNTAPVSSR